MAVTLEQVVGLADLSLRVVTVAPTLDRTLRWVATSELTDPAPWIEPGDLVLTTGMAIRDDRDQAEAYVRRLTDAQAAGLGFGIGLHHDTVPVTLVAAAEAAGLPLVEVPVPVPFVAVSRAVSRLQAAEEYAESGAAYDSQRRMIRNVLAAQAADDGEGSAPAQAAVDMLARHLGGFVLHLAPAGEVLHASPTAAAERAGEFLPEVDRLRPRGLLASASLSSAQEHIALVPIGVRETVRGFLVAGSPTPLTSADQTVLNLAVSLLAWSGSQSAGAGRAQDGWRGAMVELGRLAGFTSARLSAVGFAAIDPACAVAVVVIPALSERSASVLLDQAEGFGGDILLASDTRGGLVGIASAEVDGSVVAALRSLSAVEAVRTVGVSAVMDLTRPENVQQAVEQAEAAARSGSGLRRFADLEAGSLASLVDRGASQAWARTYLQSLRAVPEGGELQQTLYAWLACHGQVDATAQRLGIHRHTVRHRLRRAESVLQRSLDDPEVRANLWFALAGTGDQALAAAEVVHDEQ